MNNQNEQKKKKGGFFWPFSGLSKGGSAVGGISGVGSSAGGSSLGGLAGLFASKAGIVGMVLGGATIAAGIGVIYNFIGPSAKPMYSPDLFQDSYYEEEASKASYDRSRSRDASAAGQSTLDMFRDQAKKDGLGFDVESGEGKAAAAEGGAPADASANAAAEAAGNVDAEAPSASGGFPKLNPSGGFSSKLGGGMGGGGTAIPKMQAAGGLAGGIGAAFKPVNRSGSQGKVSGMTASAARMKSSPKYSLRSDSRKGAYGQAKFAGKMGAKAAYAADGAGARSSASEAFSGESSGSGDVGAIGGGSGLDGAGVSSGANLKGNDPSLNKSDVTPPKPPEPEDVDPWEKYEMMAQFALMAGALLLMITKKLAKNPMTMQWAYVACAATCAAASISIFAGIIMMTKYGQKMMGGVYVAAGMVLIYKALEAVGMFGGGDAAKGACPGGDCGGGAGASLGGEGL